MIEKSDGSRRETIWPQAVRIYPGYDKYLSRVGSREVPIFILSRATASV